MEHARNLLIFFFIPLFFASCFTVASEDDLEMAKKELAQDIRNIESAIIDAIPLPIPKDATKELVGWISDMIVIGGGTGGAGLLALNKARNGKSKEKGSKGKT